MLFCFFKRDGHGGGKCWIRATAFCVVLLLFLEGVQFVLQPKWSSDSNSYARIKLFYKEKYSPDVVFVGNSQVYYNVNPLQMFQEQGFTSYDFAAPGGVAEAVPLYVKEAIKKYAPEVIVIDAQAFTVLDAKEYHIRGWLDALPLTIQKISTALSATEKSKVFSDEEAELSSGLSYVFPILRYHDRWKELTLNAFVLDQMVRYYHGAVHYHGYGTHYRTVAADFSHYYDQVEHDAGEIVEMKRLFTQAVALCRESSTRLLLIKTPAPYWRQDWHDLIDSWAAEYDIPFVDYNDLREELDIRDEEDYQDAKAHLNDSGVTKLSNALGQYLADHYDLPDHRGDPDYAQWDEDWQVYQQDKASYFLSNETNWTAYLEKLQNPKYTIFMAVRDNLGGEKHPELTEQLKTLGLTPEMDAAARTGYLAVIDGGEVVYEHLEDVPLTWEADISGHHVEMASESYNCGNRASIQFDWTERSLNRRGINILVYDNLLEDVVDRVTFDLYGGGNAYR